ncbi:MAG: 16S rRNA (guanine(966)-N(2))-methyltransferase RsmD [Clostridia bacterium]|nr:16S rRNA (guanine(966)-N(2))-methyltransferase RsmD [Clostridia bacterium]
MRVITGLAKGRRLKSLPGEDVRPTTDKVKEGLFSAIQFDIEGRRFLDLFAGSGQMGIEALSRGCQNCVFVDASKQAISVTKENISVCGFEENSRVINGDALSFLATCKETFDIAFLDPPYKAGLLEKSLYSVTGIMSNYGIIICEHPNDITLPEQVNGFKLSKLYRYGKINLTVYKKENENE